MDRGTWWATVHGVAMSRTQLSDQTTTTTTHFISSLKILQARPVTLSGTRKPGWDDLTKIQKPLTGRLWTRNQVCLTSNIQLLFSCTCLLPWWAEKGFLCSVHWMLSHETTAQWGSGTSCVTWRKTCDLKDARISSIKIKSAITTTGTQRESRWSHSPKHELLQRPVKPSQVQMAGLQMKKAQSLSSGAPGLQRAQTEPGDPEGCEEACGEGAKPLGQWGLSRTLKGAPELTEHPRLKEETHGKAQGWQLSRGNPPGLVLSNKKNTFKYTTQKR